MEYYDVFIKVLLREVAKFKLNLDVYSTHVAQLTATLDENFDIPYYRCAYMYRYATVLTHFFNDCIKNFFSSYSLTTKDIFSMWKSYTEVKICSLSTGPGLDYIGFMLAVLEYDLPQPNFAVTVVSKHGAWRNTKNLILEVFNDPGSEFSKKNLQYQNVNLIQVDFLLNYSLGKVIAASEANVIFMMKTLNLLAPGTSQEGPLLQMFKEFISSLKPKTIIFCLDTKPSIAVLTQALLHLPGKFLHGPILQTAQLPATFPEFNGHHPTLTARGVFFVWQKLPDSLFSIATPISTSFGTNSNDNLISFDTSFNKPTASSVENVTNIEVKDSDDKLNLPWMELKSFWQFSSPKTKDILQRLMLTDEESLEHTNDFMSQSQKADTNKKNSLKACQNLAVKDDRPSKKQDAILNTTETAKSEGTKVISTPSQREFQDLRMDNQKNTFDNCYDLHSYSNGSPSPSDTLNSVSSFTCDNTSSGKTFQQNIDILPISNETLCDYHELSEKDPKKTYTKEAVMPKENCEVFLSSENKTVQTDRLLDNATAPSSVKVLTDRIRQLVISLESVSQQNDPPNSSGGNFFPLNQHNEELANHTHFNDKPSCSKQSTSFVFKEQGSLQSYHSYRSAPCQNMGGHYSCQCYHNRCMNCCFQPCCAQPILRCSFSCNHQHSRENNSANVTSPNIVIPLQSISDNALLQIISILKSESKN